MGFDPGTVGWTKGRWAGPHDGGWTTGRWAGPHDGGLKKKTVKKGDGGDLSVARRGVGCEGDIGGMRDIGGGRDMEGGGDMPVASKFDKADADLWCPPCLQFRGYGYT